MDKKTIGIIGGGQLGRMISLAASYMGHKTHIFNPSDCPAFAVTNQTTQAEYTDTAALEAFAKSVDVVTLEFENIPVSSVEIIEKITPVYPSSKTLRTAQNRVLEKTFLREAGIPIADFHPINTYEDFTQAVDNIGRPSVLKTAMFGYDGKGQYKIESETDLQTAWNATGDGEKILESWVPFDCEISVIVARGLNGEIRCFPPTENVHKNHILDTSTVPANISADVIDKAINIATKIAEKLDLIGLIAVEMFVCSDGEVLVNEIAPRPHNSGHWTMEGCVTSQFEQLVRAVLGLPLGSVDVPYEKVVMTNLIGDDVNNFAPALADPHTKIHIYGKDEVKTGRKMGHITTVYK